MDKITIERLCRCTKFVLNIPSEKRSEFEKKFKNQFPDGQLDTNDIVHICIKDEEDFKAFIKKCNELK